MAWHTRRPSIPDAQSAKVSRGKSVLRWLKKAVGLGSPHKQAGAQRTTRRNGQPKRALATSTHRARVHSFTLPQDPTEPHEPETETKRHFHTTGSKYVVRLSDASPPHRTVTTAALAHRPLLTYEQQLQPPPHVLIVGASLSGLCLAQGLKRAGIPFTVFEGDATTASSDTYDGYHTQIDTLGYEALKAMLPDDTFELLLRCAGQAFPDVVQRDASTAKRLSGDSLRQSLGANKLVFSVDRSVLRAVLLQGLDEGTEIQYKRVFKRYHMLPNKTIEVHFANGLFARGSILVGADGRESRVREQYAPNRVGGLMETDCCVIYGRTPVTAGLSIANLASKSNATVMTSVHPLMALRIEPLHVPSLETAELASAPAAVGLSRGKHRGKKHDPRTEDETVCWSLMARTDQFLINTHVSAQEAEALAPHKIFTIAHRAIQSWHPLARAVVETADLESCTLHRLRTAPATIPAWAPSRVTLIGDAAHSLLPSSLATTLALQDATVLCERLVHLGVGVPAVAMYEKLMRLTAHEAVLASVHTHHSLIGMPPLDRMAPVPVGKKTVRPLARARP